MPRERGSKRRDAAAEREGKARPSAKGRVRGAPEPADADAEELIRAARAVRAQAYAPYSGFLVGAALRSVDGRVFLGVNVENSAYPSGLCAEHGAVAAAVSFGARSFESIAVVAAPRGKGGFASPCGKCRQVLSEFGLDLVIYLAGPEGGHERVLLRDLLPRAFTPRNL